MDIRGAWTQHSNLSPTIDVRNLAALSHRLKGRTIHLHEDNQAVMYILRKKTSRNPLIMSHLRKLWALSI